MTDTKKDILNASSDPKEMLLKNFKLKRPDLPPRYLFVTLNLVLVRFSSYYHELVRNSKCIWLCEIAGRYQVPLGIFLLNI